MKAPLPQSLTIKAGLLFLAVAALMLAEVYLALSMGRRLEAATDDLAGIDRRGQVLLVSAAKMNDLLHDLAEVEYRPDEVTQAALVHLHSHIIALAPIETEMRRNGEVPTTAPVGDLLARSSSVQIDPTPLAVTGFVLELRPVVESLSGEAMRQLIRIDGERKRLAIGLEQTRGDYGLKMAVVGIGGAVGIAAVTFLFFVALARNLHHIGMKAAAIGEGDYLGPPLSEKRRDELGMVMRAVNALSARLAERDHQLDELRSRFGQQEKLFALGTFAAGMAHEVGNPIQAISALAGQVGESLAEDPSPENVRASLPLVDAIQTQCDRLARTVADIRDFAHPGRGEVELVDVNELVRTTTGLMRFDMRFRHLPLEVECNAAGGAVRAVNDHLVQVMMNLLVNAADAMEGRDGSIRVVTSDTEQGVRIEVRDCGAGMAREVLEQAWQPFFTTKPRRKGTGLGLTICRSIVEQHRGHMSIASEPGIGTTVSLDIPRGQA